MDILQMSGEISPSAPSYIFQRRIQRHILGSAPMEDVMLIVGDVNRDDKITSQDLRQAQRFILGLTASVQPAPTAE